MINVETVDVGAVLKTRVTRRSAIRKVLTTAAGAAALAALGRDAKGHDGILSGGGLDAAVLNFALNLEYLEAEFYSYATTGAGIEAQGVGVSGSGTPGTTLVKDGARVPFTTPLIQQFAEELNADEVAHAKFIRAALSAAGVQPVARPAIDLRDSFTAAAVAAGIIQPGQTFDPFADEGSFLLGSFVFEDVGVTAYNGASRLLTNKDFLESAAGILGAEGYHAGIIRALIYQAGPAARDIAQKISDLRDSVDGADDRDQGLVLNGRANLIPTDEFGRTFSRDARQVLNIVYLAPDATKGGFFPNGLNGPIH